MSEAVHVNPGSLLSKHRIEALSDGVCAVVMRLLVLEIKPEMEPQAGDEAVRHMLRALALPFLTFAFLINCIVWSLHHRKFALLRCMIVLTAFGVIATTSCYLNLPYLLLFSVPIFMYLRFRKETSPAS